jgi:diguanylate cyclase (GGDEF)-like protein
MVQDISDRKQLELLLQEHASNDPLTGLANRCEGATYLTAQAELCHLLNLHLGLAFIDIDHFKAVNDIYGHLAGDRVIQQVAQVLKGSVRIK